MGVHQRLSRDQLGYSNLAVDRQRHAYEPGSRVLLPWSSSSRLPQLQVRQGPQPPPGVRSWELGLGLQERRHHPTRSEEDHKRPRAHSEVILVVDWTFFSDPHRRSCRYLGQS